MDDLTLDTEELTETEVEIAESDDADEVVLASPPPHPTNPQQSVKTTKEVTKRISNSLLKIKNGDNPDSSHSLKRNKTTELTPNNPDAYFLHFPEMHVVRKN